LPRNKVAHIPKTHWQVKDHKRAVAVYKGTGSIQKTSDITGIPYGTLEKWMRTDWWKENLLALKAEDSTVLEDAATNLAKQSADVVKERLANGDFVLNRDGGVVRKPVNARDAAIILGISLSKRKELMDGPEQEFKLGTSERLLKLVEQFTRFANAKEIKGVLAEQREDQQARELTILETNEQLSQRNNNETISLEASGVPEVDVPEAGQPEEAT
jgi:hypothetical protein